MEQHPIPQQISSYQFRLVGEMTLKQFFQVASGALVALLIYATNLHPFLKWPLVIFSLAFGAALAFVPLQERPLSKWLLVFFRSVYSPTIRLWKKQPSYVFFKEEAAVPQQKNVIAPHGEEAMNEYLKAKPEEKLPYVSNLEQKEKGFLKNIGNLFSQFGTAKQIDKTPTSTGQVVIEPAQREETKPPVYPTRNYSSIPYQEPNPTITMEKDIVSNSQGVIRQKAQIPVTEPVQVPRSEKRPRIIVEENVLYKDQPEAAPISQTFTPIPSNSSQSSDVQNVQFSKFAAPPNPPSIPNTIAGQVIDSEGKIVDGAILEIRDIAGRPVRALRSNKAGHFLIVTALQNGKYEVVIEKEGLVFDPVAFEARGDLIPPIAIRSRNSILADNTQNDQGNVYTQQYAS